MGTITTTDGTEIFYKDWGSGQAIVFSHGWPLSADDWDTQMLFFLHHGYRVIAADRRGHGRSSQTDGGHDMDHYADDLAALTAHLDLHDAVHVGHSTGGGEVVRYIARHGESRVAKAVLISSVPPLMVQTDANPGGLPKSVFDDLQAQLAANRSEFYRALPSGPFYGFNRPGVEPSEAIIENWWRQGMMGGAKAHYDGIVAFSQTDFTEDLKKSIGARAGDARRRRPDRPLRRLRPAVRAARAERDAEDLSRIPTRHADHPSRDDQRRSAGLHPVLRRSFPAQGSRFRSGKPGLAEVPLAVMFVPGDQGLCRPREASRPRASTSGWCRAVDRKA
jgi:non-heme chloroperoxidase